jgi:hypothetical protein
VLADKPGLRLTPDALSDAIARAGATVRADDHAALTSAIKAFAQSEKAVTGSLASARTAADQDKRLKRIGLNCTIAGMIIWAILPGMVIRAMPESWQLPERMTAKAIGADPGLAGQRLMMFAHPEDCKKNRRSRSHIQGR